ncbi:MAG: MATE family efflux transporter [Pseudomonadota bacterium]
MSEQARFLTGSTMRHVTVMTLAGSLGLMFIFLVDFATLFWVGRAGGEDWVAAAGFAFTIQFFAVSFGIGLMIASVSLVSRALGEGNVPKARKLVTTAAIWGCGVQTVTALTVIVFRHQLLAWLGAEGEVAHDAARYLAISMPSLPIMAISMMGSSALRAAGDAYRSMMVTLGAGVVVMFVDPFLVIYLELGLDGAAIGIIVSRFTYLAFAAWYVLGVHKLASWVTWDDLKALSWPFLLIAGPAVLTQLSTPAGNAIATAVIAQFGDGAVAGWAVISRVSILAFGGIFALSGAIGGIIGQNYGAGFYERVCTTFRDAVWFCIAYVAVVWVALILLTDVLVSAFALGPDGAEVVESFTYIASAGFVFTGMLFVANSAFNSLDRAVWATGANWFRDGILMYPLCFFGALYFAAEGVIYGQAIANLIAGVIAVWIGWVYVNSLSQRQAQLRDGV